MDTTDLKKGYQTNAKRISALCGGVSQETATTRPMDKINSLVWEVGHLTFVRNTVIKLLNPTEKLEVTENEKELFGNGSKPADAAQYPSLESVVELLNKRGDRIYELLDNTTQNYLNSESPIKIPHLGDTPGQLIYTFMIHEANHYGEMNIIKKLAV